MRAPLHTAARGAEDRGDLARLVAGLRLQVRIIKALLLREMQTRFGRSQLGFLWLFLEPLMLALAIASMKSFFAFGQKHPGISPFIFALVGYLPYFAFRGIVTRAPGTLRANMTLLYHSRIKLIDVVLARHILEMAAIIGVMAFIVVGVGIWGNMPPHSVPILLLALILLFLLANGVGLLAAAASASSEIASHLIGPMVYISLPLSGALIALHSLDPQVRAVLLWNPQANIHEMVREGFFGNLLPSYYSVSYVLFCVAVLNLLGLAALRAVRPKLVF